MTSVSPSAIRSSAMWISARDPLLPFDATKKMRQPRLRPRRLAPKGRSVVGGGGDGNDSSVERRRRRTQTRGSLEKSSGPVGGGKLTLQRSSEAATGKSTKGAMSTLRQVSLEACLPIAGVSADSLERVHVSEASPRLDRIIPASPLFGRSNSHSTGTCMATAAANTNTTYNGATTPETPRLQTRPLQTQAVDLARCMDNMHASSASPTTASSSDLGDNGSGGDGCFLPAPMCTIASPSTRGPSTSRAVAISAEEPQPPLCAVLEMNNSEFDAHFGPPVLLQRRR